jgi:8-oxo-dGTP pyrophosphatase MutT (NUDIX family)
MTRKLHIDLDFKDKLRQALMGEKPGSTSHLKMASRIRRSEMKFKYHTDGAVPSSVLILLYPREGQLHTVFILRQTYDGVHSGQVSFPGGRAEPEDRDLIHTALREASEEVAIDPASVEVLGTLSELYIPPSNFLVLPVVGFTAHAPRFVADETEVAEIIQSDISFLNDPARRKETTLEVRGLRIDTPYYDVKGKIIWGATAMILSELSDLIEINTLTY